MAINYDGRRFHEGDGEPGLEAPVVVFRQQGDVVWAQSTHAGTHHGSLAGVCAQDGTLEFAYAMVLKGGTVVSGHSFAAPETLPDGRIRLVEKWERYGANAATGTTDFVEITD